MLSPGNLFVKVIWAYSNILLFGDPATSCDSRLMKLLKKPDVAGPMLILNRT